MQAPSISSSALLPLPMATLSVRRLPETTLRSLVGIATLGRVALFKPFG
jgi:hypothetical protein